ncbi:conjugal transfer protein [Clostridioides difficile]|uniref:antirestriction protein ArdA n=1 Tax=Clostridium innocuum TaxID=1522 RepID=UPI001FEEC317|nr:antirestriction protein ArdA [[Clostridium] innocuum]MBY1995492.1 antirestriction protein ArdA [Clostridioides difficile]MCI2987376.1 antirestriction protein ArdA [[Clostridium] innocuum]MDB2780148.1 conjugal transfer protein [Clostridioides difficile]
MQDLRIQLEALHPTELTEQKSAWFTLPIYEDELSETLGIEEDSEDFTVADIDLPYDFIKAGDETITLDEINEVYYMFENLPSDIQDEIEAIMEEYDCLEDLHNQRHDIYCYSGCHSMADVAREILNDTGELRNLPEYLQEHFDYASYGESLEEDGTWVITGSGVFKLPY